MQINIKGVALDSTAAFRTLISDSHPQWALTPVSSTDYRLNIRPSEALNLRRDTVERSIRTIENRINGLGLTQATVQQRGRSDAESEILVQMPAYTPRPVSRGSSQTAALLELVEAKDGPFRAVKKPRRNMEAYFLSTRGWCGTRRAAGKALRPWYVLSRSAVVTGRDVRNARPGRDQFNKWETDFTLSQDAAKRFGSSSRRRT